MRIFLYAALIVVVAFLAGCVGETVYAPVTSISIIDPIPRSGVYHVRRSDTLYSIAWRYGLDYRYLAKINHFPPASFTIQEGQTLYLRPSATVATKIKSNHLTPAILNKTPHSVIPINQPVKMTAKIANPARLIEKEPNFVVRVWNWPAKGPVVGTFSGFNKGLNIGGHLNDPIYAAANGKIVYSGNGLRDYGNLIIIKHNSVFLSAYAYNSVILVKEGDWVKAGQKIAEMGDTRDHRVMLHFEIRCNGKPVNPLGYLAR